MALNVYQTPVMVLGGIAQDANHLNVFQFPVMVLGTTYVPPIIHDLTPTGGASIAGSGYETFNDTEEMFGGVSGNSTIQPTSIYETQITGDVFVAGVAESGIKTTVGSSGGVAVSKTAIIELKTNIVASGCIVASGVATVTVVEMVLSNGLLASGIAFDGVTKTIAVSGGSYVSGNYSPNSTVSHIVSGGIVTSGIAIDNSIILNYRYTSDGHVSIDGNSRIKITKNCFQKISCKIKSNKSCALKYYFYPLNSAILIRGIKDYQKTMVSPIIVCRQGGIIKRNRKMP